MLAKKTSLLPAIIIFSVLCLLASGCQLSEASSLSKEAQKVDKLLSEGKMLHAKQVVEFYNENSESVPRYYELWIAKDKAFCRELDKNGNTLEKILDDGDIHISYQPVTLKAIKHETSRVFVLSPEKLADMESYGVKLEESYKYCKRPCRVYSMSNGKAEEELRLYMDEETGYLLFCDSPLFCVKTALLEVLPYAADLFRVPEGIKYE